MKISIEGIIGLLTFSFLLVETGTGQPTCIGCVLSFLPWLIFQCGGVIACFALHAPPGVSAGLSGAFGTIVATGLQTCSSICLTPTP